MSCRDASVTANLAWPLCTTMPRSKAALRRKKTPNQEIERRESYYCSGIVTESALILGSKHVQRGRANMQTITPQLLQRLADPVAVAGAISNPVRQGYVWIDSLVDAVKVGCSLDPAD